MHSWVDSIDEQMGCLLFLRRYICAHDITFTACSCLRYFDIRSRKGKDRRDKLQELSHSNHAKSSSIALESTSTHSYSSSHRKSSKSNDSSSTFHRFLMARERFLGLYLGSFVNYGLYFAASMILSASDHSMEFAQQLMNEPGSWSSSYSTDDKQSKYSLYSFNGQYYISLSGLNGYINHRRLFVASFVLFIFSGFLWLWVVWLFPDPGIINTRERDFNEVCTSSHYVIRYIIAFAALKCEILLSLCTH